MEQTQTELHVALVHYPVVNKFNDVVTSSVTTLDVHDMARLCRTYGARALHVITPLQAQRRLVERVMSHWISGFGGEYNPDRKEALGLVKVVDSIEDMIDNLSLSAETGLLVATSAKGSGASVSYREARARLKAADKAAILFGTAHGLDESLLERSDVLLKPIEGVNDYNHLPVRCAASIILDRLLGPEDTER